MEGGGTERRFDRPCSDADSDSHTVGCPVAKGVNVGVHELFTPNEMLENCDAQQASHASDGQTNKTCWEASRRAAAEQGEQKTTLVDDWRWVASIGGWR